jgi:hypothetical protein
MGCVRSVIAVEALYRDLDPGGQRGIQRGDGKYQYAGKAKR